MFAGLFASCRRVEPFEFVQMSDTQIGFLDETPRYAHSDSLMAAAVAASNALKPDFVVITGDLIDDWRSELQDSIYRANLAKLESKVYELPGNHDIQAFNRERHQLYLAKRGYDRFSFRHKGCAFIGMDSNCIKDGATEFEASQKEWLVSELKAAKGARYIFVFMHCPVIREAIDEAEDYFNFSADKRREYIDLFKEYGVKAVFSGHCHQEWACTYDGIDFFVAGPVANAIGHGKPGYNVVTVAKDSVQVEYVPTPGT